MQNRLGFVLVIIRATAGASPWRQVKGVMGEKRSVYVTGKHEWTRDDGTNRETTEGPSLGK